eukprot:scaffold103763_cov22-Tisochrysis_lutea.AAC.2
MMHLNRVEVCDSAVSSQCTHMYPPACGAPSGHGSALIGGQGERDVLVLHATLYLRLVQGQQHGSPEDTRGESQHGKAMNASLYTSAWGRARYAAHPLDSRQGSDQAKENKQIKKEATK